MVDYNNRVIAEVPYEVVVSRIKWFDRPINEWPNRIQIDLPNGIRVRFGYKQFLAIKNPVCVMCGAKGVKFKIIEPKVQRPPGHRKNPKLALFTQDDVLLTRDHIIPRCQGGTSDLDNIQVLCCRCNNLKSITDVHPTECVMPYRC